MTGAVAKTLEYATADAAIGRLAARLAIKKMPRCLSKRGTILS